jgi:hypothetical protein
MSSLSRIAVLNGFVIFMPGPYLHWIQVILF